MLDPVILAGGKFWQIIRRGVYIAYYKSFTVEKFRGSIGNRETFPVKYPVR